jgi:hypothetical protein
MSSQQTRFVAITVGGSRKMVAQLGRSARGVDAHDTGLWLAPAVTHASSRHQVAVWSLAPASNRLLPNSPEGRRDPPMPLRFVAPRSSRSKRLPRNLRVLSQASGSLLSPFHAEEIKPTSQSASSRRPVRLLVSITRQKGVISAMAARVDRPHRLPRQRSGDGSRYRLDRSPQHHAASPASGAWS